MATRAAATDQIDPDALLLVLNAFKAGDFSARLPSSWTGVGGKVADAVNHLIEQNQRFSHDLDRVGRVVGKEGRISQRISSGSAMGDWARSIDTVNDLIEDLVRPTSEISRVIGSVAGGDLSQTVSLEVDGRPLQGQFARTAKTVNTMVTQLSSFASEVTRVAREVGTEGKLGGQARVKDVGGVWKDLTDSVNTMAGNLTGQIRNIAEVTTAVANGDLSKKITVEGRGEILELKNTINVMVDQLNSFSTEVTRVAREVGTGGKLGGQAEVKGVSGTWKDLTDNVNLLAGQLTSQIRNIADVTTAVANGDLSKKVTVDVQGEILALKNTMNVMVDQLNSFAGEVTRVAREVGTEGKLGGQAQVRGVSGTWKDLTDNVNSMAANLTEQVRGIARVVTAVAGGDLKRKLFVEAKGEVAALAETINEMTDTLATFADQVTGVAREVGVEGRLGGQASVPGASGTWKDLTDNVNQLAATLTDQIRAIAEVATAVTEGDLTRSIGVEASGEVAILKDRINEMIRTLRETTQRNTEQDWLKTNLNRFTGMLQGQRDLMTVSKLILSELAPLVSAQHGVFYTIDSSKPEEATLRFQAGYAYRERKSLATVFRLGEGLVGQCALEKERILLAGVPGDYVQINSGLGSAPPMNIIVIPVLFEGEVQAVIELASFERFSATHQDFLDQLTESIGIVLNTIQANMRTEELLKQSQSLAQELQSQQEELRQTNDELEQKAHLLARQNTEVERKNLEVEQARRSLEEKAEQLAITSKYKSEFLANMSHELRTPLNSLLILAQQLAENHDANLTAKQVEFANIIKASGHDLLNLINDILDLTKIESGMFALEIGEEPFSNVRDLMERTFRHIADSKGLGFAVKLVGGLPAGLQTDSKRLQQVLKNLLSNAFKFTEEGRVALTMRRADDGWDRDLKPLREAADIIAFEVHDTGIGIPRDKQRTVFEAFQQADGTTSRKYGGTGLGLSISRELVRLMGGQIALRSEPGRGSTFTVFLPARFAAQGTPMALEPAPVGGGEGSPDAGPAIREELFQAAPTASALQGRHAEVPDDRYTLEPGDSVVLIVEDDPNFCKVLLDLAHQNHFKGILALSGAEALSLAREYKPSAVTLDIGLRDISGWKVLDSLQQDPLTREIPVHIVTVFEDAQEQVETKGANTFIAKPATKEALEGLFTRIQAFIDQGVRNLLVVEDNEVQRQAIVDAIGNDSLHTTAVATGKEAMAALRKEKIDCVVLDLGLPDMSGFKLLEQVQKSPELRQIPIIVYTAAELSTKDRAALRKAAKSVIVKGGESSSDELTSQVSRFLNRVGRAPGRPLAKSPPSPVFAAASAPPLAVEGGLAGRTVMVVDDDVRNIFALTALLEREGIRVVSAEAGNDAIEMLRAGGSGTELVLMDVMMPIRDGYETMREIRQTANLASLPIIALTAKAMKGDRELCIDAGASDYIAKPIDPAQLLAMLRSWLRVSGA